MLSRRSFLSTSASIAASAMAGTFVCSAAAREAAGRRHDGLELPLARLAHGRAVPASAIPSTGSWHRPPFDVVSAYVDQTPKNDLSRQRAEEFGFTIYPTIAEALRCGGDKLAVDAVLIIGEHGDYPINEHRPEAVPALRVLQAGRRGLPQGRPHGAGLQRQAPVVEVGVGEGDGRDRRAS